VTHADRSYSDLRRQVDAPDISPNFTSSSRSLLRGNQ